jgi:hypothetical protein
VGKQPGQPVVELGIETEDRRCRRRHHLLSIALENEGFEAFLRRQRGYEYDPHGKAVGARRAPAHEIVQGEQLVVRNPLVEPFVLGARLTENHVQRCIVQRRTHGFLLVASNRNFVVADRGARCVTS